MKNNVMSSNFTYENMDCILLCDGSLLTKDNISTIGWVIIDAKTFVTISEGRSIIHPTTTTTQSELFSVVIGLLEAQKMNFNNVMIKTDFEGFIIHMDKNNKKISEFEILDKILNKFNSWGIEKIPRGELSRPHNLCSSIDTTIDYCPKININDIEKTI